MRLIILFFTLTIVGWSAQAQTKISEFGQYEGYSEERTKKSKYRSYYIETRDSLKLAADVFLPKDLKDDEQLPTIVYLTRYIRTLRGKWFIRWLKNPIFGQVSEEEVEYWTKHGYAVVLVDVRGTGASTGIRTMEFSPAEIHDGEEVVDWIIGNSWSNGKVGVTGISYLGTTAELLLVNQHPAVKACIPRSNIFDLYNDITYPGGIPHSEFIEVWKDLTLSLDVSDLSVVSKQAKRLIKGASPVKGERKVLKAALEDHKNNFDIFQALLEVDYKDELHPDLGRPITDYGISNYIDEIANSGTAIYRIDGWWDGGLVRSAIYGYLTTPNTEKLTIGPWDHGPAEQVSPFVAYSTVKFDLYAEMLRFFDFHLKDIDNGFDQDPPIQYYTFGQEQWKSSELWPPAEAMNDTLFLSDAGRLVDGVHEKEGESSTYEVDYTVGTGDAAGWNSMTPNYRRGGPINYPDRAEVNSSMEVYTSEALSKPLEITGHPYVELYMSIPTTDGALFAYLEHVSPDGFVQYITEGQVRLIHREVKTDKLLPTIGPYLSYYEKDARPVEPGEVEYFTFELLPTSYEVPAGHSIRLSLAGSDVHHFQLTDIRPDEMTFWYSDVYDSRIILPVVKAEDVGETGAKD